MICMSFFVLLLTELWAKILNKDPEIYRSYCVMTFAFWWSFSKLYKLKLEESLYNQFFFHLKHSFFFLQFL